MPPHGNCGHARGCARVLKLPQKVKLTGIFAYAHFFVQLAYFANINSPLVLTISKIKFCMNITKRAAVEASMKTSTTQIVIG